MDFDGDFLTPSETSRQAYGTAMEASGAAILRYLVTLTKPYGGSTPTRLAESINKLDVCPEEGLGLRATLDLIGHSVLKHSMVVSDPSCFGHLHCPPLIAALAAEQLICAANQSLDS